MVYTKSDVHKFVHTHKKIVVTWNTRKIKAISNLQLTIIILFLNIAVISITVSILIAPKHCIKNPIIIKEFSEILFINKHINTVDIKHDTDNRNKM